MRVGTYYGARGGRDKRTTKEVSCHTLVILNGTAVLVW